MDRPSAGLGAAYDAASVKLIDRVFDEAWEDIAGNYGSIQAVEAARSKLASIILSLAPSSGVLDVERMKYTALVAMSLRE